MPSWSTSLKVDWENEEMKDERRDYYDGGALTMSISFLI
jgi:hypothetical protein